MSELIRLQNIHKAYWMGPDRVPVLHGVDLTVNEGEFVAIMGASGSGKSTLLHIAGGLDVPDTGPVAPGGKEMPAHPNPEVFYRAEPLTSAGNRHRNHLRNKEFGFVFQFYHLLPELNVLENVLLPAMIESTPRWLVIGIILPALILVSVGLSIVVIALLLIFAAGLNAEVLREIGAITLDAGLAILILTGVSAFVRTLYRLIFRRAAKKREALALLTSFGLAHRLRHRPSQLSGGERQRVAIARALINRPALLLADEPTGNLDAETGASILNVLIDLHKTRGQTMLLVTHDPNVAALADRTVHLHAGRLQNTVSPPTPKPV